MILVFNLFQKWSSYHRLMMMSMEELNEMMDNKEVLDQYIDSEGMIKDVKENIERFKNNTI